MQQVVTTIASRLAEESSSDFLEKIKAKVLQGRIFLINIKPDIII